MNRIVLLFNQDESERNNLTGSHKTCCEPSLNLRYSLTLSRLESLSVILYQMLVRALLTTIFTSEKAATSFGKPVYGMGLAGQFVACGTSANILAVLILRMKLRRLHKLDCYCERQWELVGQNKIQDP